MSEPRFVCIHCHEPYQLEGIYDRSHGGGLRPCGSCGNESFRMIDPSDALSHKEQLRLSEIAELRMLVYGLMTAGLEECERLRAQMRVLVSAWEGEVMRSRSQQENAEKRANELARECLETAGLSGVVELTSQRDEAMRRLGAAETDLATAKRSIDALRSECGRLNEKCSNAERTKDLALDGLKRDRVSAGQTMREFQSSLPWGAHDYNDEFRHREAVQRDAEHAYIHVTRALAKAIVYLSGAIDGFSHEHDEVAQAYSTRIETGKALADLVICSARIANTYPVKEIDLQEAIESRIAGKFPKKAGDE